ncbi:MAG: hypothetical protein PUE58_07450 [Lachnospiraceae bacterium]|nr:hypothetical protein [Lachnospiraceae bacterium]
MKKFEIVEHTEEIKNKSAIVPGCTESPEIYESHTNIDKKILKSFDTLEKAKTELENYVASISKESGSAGTYYLVTEYMIEENDYDEDGEWISGGDIWEFSKFPNDYYISKIREDLIQMRLLEDYLNHNLSEEYIKWYINDSGELLNRSSVSIDDEPESAWNGNAKCVFTISPWHDLDSLEVENADVMDDEEFIDFVYGDDLNRAFNQ